MTLTEFLEARIAEDEADARFTRAHSYGSRVGGFTPARVLAECEVKRRIVRDAQANFTIADLDGPNWDDAAESHIRAIESLSVLRVLAAVFADHPDYDEAWRP